MCFSAAWCAVPPTRPSRERQSVRNTRAQTHARTRARSHTTQHNTTQTQAHFCTAPLRARVRTTAAILTRWFRRSTAGSAATLTLRASSKSARSSLSSPCLPYRRASFSPLACSAPLLYYRRGTCGTSRCCCCHSRSRLGSSRLLCRRSSSSSGSFCSSAAPSCLPSPVSAHGQYS